MPGTVSSSSPISLIARRVRVAVAVGIAALTVALVAVESADAASRWRNRSITATDADARYPSRLRGRRGPSVSDASYQSGYFAGRDVGYGDGFNDGLHRLSYFDRPFHRFGRVDRHFRYGFRAGYKSGYRDGFDNGAYTAIHRRQRSRRLWTR
jgi:hypothetical protein